MKICQCGEERLSKALDRASEPSNNKDRANLDENPHLCRGFKCLWVLIGCLTHSHEIDPGNYNLVGLINFLIA